MAGKALVLATAMDGDETTSTVMRGRQPLGETTQTGLILYEPEKISYELYLEMGRLFGDANRRLQWVIGDWLNMVEKIYPDRYSQAIEATGLSKQTLMNRASICGRIPIERRRDGVPFSVHAEVAYMEPKERERWLDKATKNDWDRDTLREYKRAAREEDSGSADDVVASSSGDLMLGSRTCPTCGQEINE